MSPTGIGARLVAAVGRIAVLGLVASGLVLQGQAPAVAAGCTGSTGVTVVVDFNQLGGGVRQACDADGGGKAGSIVFPDSGFPLAYVQRQPGFVCRVSGTPSSDPCVNTPPTSAYWSLWWSDGKSGTWSYASVGVGSLKVPSGGYVALSWQGQEGRTAPGVTPTPRAATSSPKPSPAPGSPKPGDGSSGGTGPGKGGGSTPAPGDGSDGASPSVPGGTASPGATPSADGKPKGGGKSGKARASKSAAPSPSDEAEATDDEVSVDSPPSGGDPTDTADPSSDDSRLPAWVSVLAVGGLLAAAASVAVIRSRRARP